MSNKVIGIDIGGTNFRIGIVGPEGELSAFQKIPVRDVFSSDDPISDLASFLRGFLSENDMPSDDPAQAGSSHPCGITAIGMGFPSPVDKAHKTVLQSPNMPLPGNLPVVDSLSAELNIPVFIANDVELAVIYDVGRLGIPKDGIIAGIYYGTGIGNAIMINGEILAGKNGAAGELGHIPVDGVDLVCGCGNVGCAESVAGGNYLDRLCREVYTETHISEIFSSHRNEDILLQFIDRMAMTAATEVNILDPDYLLIGGGVPEMKDFPKDLLTEKILEHARKPYPADNLDIVFTGDAKEKCVLAAANYAFQNVAL